MSNLKKSNGVCINIIIKDGNRTFVKKNNIATINCNHYVYIHASEHIKTNYFIYILLQKPIDFKNINWKINVSS